MDNKFSFEAAISAAKVAFIWNSIEGSLGKFQKDLTDLLLDVPEEKIINMARSINYEGVHAPDKKRHW